MFVMSYGNKLEMIHRVSLKLWPEMRLGATVKTRKQNKHRANGKLLILQNQRSPDRFDPMLRWCRLVFFDANGIVHKEFVPPGQTVNQQFYLQVLKFPHMKCQMLMSTKWKRKRWRSWTASALKSSSNVFSSRKSVGTVYRVKRRVLWRRLQL